MLNKEDLLSRTIGNIRFPMILGIVLIHCYLNKDSSFEATVGNQSWVANLCYLLSNVICRICVPLFFAISGYLFFLNINKFDLNTYTAKLRRRVNTLLLPYLLWNLIGFLLILLYRTPPLRAFWPGLSKLNIDFNYFIDCFWRQGLINYSFFDNGGMPIDYPLWFIRNLIILCLLSPLIYIAVRKSWLPLIGLIICWIGGWWPQIDGFSITGVLFFTLGATLSLHKINPVQYLSEHKKQANSLVFLYLALALADLATRDNAGVNHYFHAIGILVGIISAVWIATLASERNISFPKYFTSATFFIYAGHGLIVHSVKAGLIRVLQPQSGFAWLGIYITIFFILTGISIALYHLLNRIAPKLTSVLVGGR